MKQSSVVLPTRSEESEAIDARHTRWLNVRPMVATPLRKEESTATDVSYGNPVKCGFDYELDSWTQEGWESTGWEISAQRRPK